MKKTLLEFLSKGTTLSSMRLGSIFIVFTSCLYVVLYLFANLFITAFNIYCQHHYATHSVSTLLNIDWEGAAWFAGAGLLGKAGQSFAENRIKKNNIDNNPVLEEKTINQGEVQNNPVREIG